MNERILELAIKAREYAESKPHIYQVAYDKKFAELLIRECLEQIDDGNSDHAGGNREAIDRIKEHFGVEQ